MKSQRRRDLLKILHEGRASTQQEFVAALRGAGHDVTQATVSRDLHDLGAVKVKVGEEIAYRFPDEARSNAPVARTGRSLTRELMEFAIDIRVAANLVVIVALPGHAAAIARAIDLAAPREVIGTIAGDDTVFVATADDRAAAQLAEKWLYPEETAEKGSL